MMGTTLAGISIGEIARRNVRAVLVLADAGISPRYIGWSVAEAARECGVNLDALLARLERALAQPTAA